ncbi:MAG TPA: hypothetical protein VKE40_19885 [Gemmataceae bacterium]|nr:hypothetical protein [Gemmataceae bacterium]
MMRLIVLSLGLAPVLGAPPSSEIQRQHTLPAPLERAPGSAGYERLVRPGSDEKPVLEHKVDGDDLITSTTIMVPGGHLVLTTFDNTDALMPGLRYTVIRNADVVDYGWRPQKIEWRLKGFAKAHPGLAPYRVSGQVISLSSAELKQLIGRASDWDKAERLVPVPAPGRVERVPAG